MSCAIPFGVSVAERAVNTRASGGVGCGDTLRDTCIVGTPLTEQGRNGGPQEISLPGRRPGQAMSQRCSLWLIQRRQPVQARSLHRIRARPSSAAFEEQAGAKRRIADEYDAAQERVAGNGGGRNFKVPEGNVETTVEDLGLTRKDIHEARRIRDVESAYCV